MHKAITSAAANRATTHGLVQDTRRPTNTPVSVGDDAPWDEDVLADLSPVLAQTPPASPSAGLRANMRQGTDTELATTPPASRSPGVWANMRRRAASLSTPPSSPSTLTMSPTTSPRNPAGRFLSNLLPQRASGAMSAPSSPQRGLVRSPRFEAPVSERRLFGVARWPNAYSPKDLEQNNYKYGLAFAKEARKIGQRIAKNKYENIVFLWADCRRWRAAYEQKFGGKNPDFGESRMVDRGGTSTAIVSGHRYEYMLPRIFGLPGADRTTKEIEQVSYSSFFETTARLRTVLEVSYTATTVDYLGQRWPLTELVGLFEPDGSPFKTREGVVTVVGTMLHTDCSVRRQLFPELNYLFKSATDPGQPQDMRLHYMAELHWLLAHAMLDRRGSAAKSEMLVRAVGYAVGIELPPFAPGIVPDLEAFLTPRTQFVARYPELFTRPPIPDPLIEMLDALSLQRRDAGNLNAG